MNLSCLIFILLLSLPGGFSHQHVFSLGNATIAASQLSNVSKVHRQQRATPIKFDISLHSWGKERGHYYERRPIEIKCTFTNVSTVKQELRLRHTSEIFPVPLPYPIGLRVRVWDGTGKIISLTQMAEDGWWHAGGGLDAKPEKTVKIVPGGEIVRIIPLDQVLRGHDAFPRGIMAGTYRIQLSLDGLISNILIINIEEAQDLSDVVKFAISPYGKARELGYYTEGESIAVLCAFVNSSNKRQEIYLGEDIIHMGEPSYPVLLKARVSTRSGVFLTTNPVIHDGWYTSYINSSRVGRTRRSEDWVTIEPGGEILRIIPVDQVLRGHENFQGGLSAGTYNLQLSLDDLMSNTVEIVVRPKDDR